MCVGVAESGGNPNTLYRAPYSQKHLRHLESALFLSNSRCEKCICYDLKSFLQTSCEVKGFVLRQCADGVLLLRV